MHSALRAHCRRVIAGAAWTRGRLFEPSAKITDLAQRRRARLLSMLQLPHIVHLVVSATALHYLEHGTVQAAIPPLLLSAVPFFIVAYSLSRTRFTRISAWLYMVVNLLMAPTAMVLLGRSPAGVQPLAAAVYLLPPILLAGAIGRALAPLAAGAIGLAAFAIAIHLAANPTLHEQSRQAVIFVGLTVALVVIFNIHRDGIESDRAAELRARNDELERLRHTLEDRIGERTAELGHRNVAMRLMLDNLSEGLLTVDKQGKVASEHSAALARWFGPVSADETFYEYLRRQSGTYGESAELAWEQLTDGFLGCDVALAQIPTQLRSNGRSYEISYRAIGDGDRPDARFLIVVSDQTDNVERHTVEREKKETLQLFERVLHDRAGVITFMAEASQLVSDITAGTLSGAAMMRALHTLKGTSMIFGLSSIADICHEAESRLEETGTTAKGDDLASLGERWARLAGDINRLLGNGPASTAISHEQTSALIQSLRAGVPRETLLLMLEELDLEPVAPRLRQLADHAGQIADRLGKLVTVEVSHDGVRLEARFSPFWGSLVHAVRNAIDHGLESPAERTAAGKPAQGTLALRARRNWAGIVIEVEDDGRGIDWAKVRRRAAALGFEGSTREELSSALFEDGVSTAPKVTDLSGRGVGMGALRSAVVDLGGRVTVRSDPGAGTLLSISFPSPEAGNRAGLVTATSRDLAGTSGPIRG